MQFSKKKNIIAAIKNEEGLQKALNSNVEVVFVLSGDICKIDDVVNRCHKANKKVYLHIEMIEGFGKDEAAVRYIANNIKPDGIITTKSSLVKAATSVGLNSIFRVFMLDSQSIKTAISNIERCKPTDVEILPGLIPELISYFSKNINANIIAGGLISTTKHIEAAFAHGAVACSTSESELWG
ncbi:MAG: glycerol-3-phosphate responsive antiterminator [Bacilli bacterium]|nr:glycerol-3-phosphate responsive antiterminator [Bacilli bacterium]